MARFRDPERDRMVGDIPRFQGKRFTYARSGFNQEDTQMEVHLAMGPDMGKQPFFFIESEEADTAITLAQAQIGRDTFDQTGLFCVS